MHQIFNQTAAIKEMFAIATFPEVVMLDDCVMLLYDFLVQDGLIMSKQLVGLYMLAGEDSCQMRVMLESRNVC